MKKKNLKILRKIIYAVETGGQVYGQCDYGDYTEAYTNSSEEHALTIGAGQWYGPEALQLLRNIRMAGGGGFTPALLDAMQRPDNWDSYSPPDTSEVATAIKKVITSKIGKQCQNDLMDSQLKKYAKEAEALGVTDEAAQAMCANFRHQGGGGAVKRILEKTPTPYTLENLYSASLTDTGNQVGAYRARQRFVYETLKERMKDTPEDVQGIRERACAFMTDLAADDSHGYDQIYRWGERGDYDCSAAVITAYQTAGVPVKTEGATYTGNMYAVFKRCGFVDVTDSINLTTGDGLMPGDVLLNHVHHTALYIGNGQEAEASINEHGGATGGQPGDQTGREVLVKSYRNYPWDCVLRYIDSEEYKPLLQIGSKGTSVMKAQKLLNTVVKCVDEDGDFGPLTDAAVKDFQERYLLEVDGIIGPETWGALEHQTGTVIKNPGVVRTSGIKAASCVETLRDGEKVNVYKKMYNHLHELWYWIDHGWIVANNVKL